MVQSSTHITWNIFHDFFAYMSVVFVSYQATKFDHISKHVCIILYTYVHTYIQACMHAFIHNAYTYIRTYIYIGKLMTDG